MSIRPGAESEIITLCRKMLAVCREQDALVHEGNDLGYSDPKDHKPKRQIVLGAKFDQFAVAIAKLRRRRKASRGPDGPSMPLYVGQNGSRLSSTGSAA